MVKSVRACGELRDADRSCGGVSAILSDYEQIPELEKLKDRKRDKKSETSSKPDTKSDEHEPPKKMSWLG